MIPVTPPTSAGQEVWARMPGRPEDPFGVESNVELMGFVLSEHWLNGQKVWRCRAFESYGVWSPHQDEEVMNVRSIRAPLSDHARFKVCISDGCAYSRLLTQADQYHQHVQVRTSADSWVIGTNVVCKSGTIEAGWCEHSPTPSGVRMKYSYWVRCEYPGLPTTRKWYQQEDLEYGLAIPQGIPRR